MPAISLPSSGGAPAPTPLAMQGGEQQPSTGDQVDQANQEQAPVEFDIHVKAAPNEIEDAIALLKEAGLDDLASQLEKALQPQSDENDQETQDSTASLQDELEAMSHNPHGV